ncbi:MAG: membrane protein insertase YidC [Bacteroidales bacterium]|nr:membrane protein insertase YidC [Bacteroidales bacterium]
MDRNSIIGILIIAVLLVGYGILNKPSKDELAERQRIQDSVATAHLEEAARRAAQDLAPAQTDMSEEAVGQPVVEDEAGVKNYVDLYGDFAEAAVGEKKLITLENDLIKLEISTLGGRPYSAELKNYQTHDSLPLILFDGDSTVFGFTFFARNRSINTNELFFTPDRKESEIVVSSEPQTLSMTLPAGGNSYIKYTYTLGPSDYMVDFDIQFYEMQELLTDRINFLDLIWEVYVPAFEKGRVNEMQNTTIFFKHYQDEVDKFNPRSKKEIMEQDISTSLEWIGYKQQFFSTVLLAEDHFSNAYLSSSKLEEPNKYLKLFTSQIGVPYQPIQDYTVNMAYYFGPNHFQTLNTYEHELQRLVSLGGPFSRVFNRYFIIPIFNRLDNNIANYGLIILILTLLIKIILFPLTYRSFLSMAKMRVLKPEIDAINAKIPKDKSMERQQATMALYKKAGVSPLGGCLPVVLQMPILIAMFRFFPTSIELRQESFLWATDLSTYDSIFDLPFTIPMYGDHISLFTLLMTASTILTMKISNQAGAAGQQMPGMKGMMYIMPVMFMFILNNFSAALTYYYFLANIITFGQNQLFKQFIDEEKLRSKLEENTRKKSATKKKSGFQKRLENMAKQRGYNPKKK